jgi:hypothetical protein
MKFCKGLKVKIKIKHEKIYFGKVNKNHKNKKRRRLYKHLKAHTWNGKILNLNKKIINTKQMVNMYIIIINWNICYI